MYFTILYSGNFFHAWLYVLTVHIYFSAYVASLTKFQWLAVIVELSKMLDVCGVKLCVLLFVYLYVRFIDLYHINFSSPSKTHKLVLLLLRNGYHITGTNLAALTVIFFFFFWVTFLYPPPGVESIIACGGKYNSF